MDLYLLEPGSKIYDTSLETQSRSQLDRNNCQPNINRRFPNGDTDICLYLSVQQRNTKSEVSFPGPNQAFSITNGVSLSVTSLRSNDFNCFEKKIRSPTDADPDV